MRRDAIPRAPAALRRYLLAAGTLHLPLRTRAHGARWQLAHRVTHQCGTPACLNVPLTRGRNHP